MPLISLVTVCRNAESTIERTLESVANQRGLPAGALEHWVIDGASTDRTLEIVQRFPHVKWISEKDKGIADAFGKGALRATGEWIQILNSDDALAGPDVLAQVLPALDPAYDFVYGRMDVMDETLTRRLRSVGDEEGWKHLGRRMTVPHPTLFSHRRVFEKYGLFDPAYKIAMDYEWLLRSYGKARFRFVPVTVTLFRSGGVSTAQLGLRQARECWQAKTKNHVGSKAARAAWFAYQLARAKLDASLPGVPVVGRAYEKITCLVRKGY
jgi:glycosyltransferase involved in cell wall biosynthesis